MARQVGQIEERRLADGTCTYRIVIRWQGQRWRLGYGLIGGHWTPFRDRADAEFVLGAIRADASSSGSFAKAVAPHLRRPDASSMIPRWLERFEQREQDRCEAEQVSPTTLYGLERMRKRGLFAYWDQTPIFSVTYGGIEDWLTELAKGGMGPKSRLNVMGELRRLLHWLKQRGEIDFVPDFPAIEWDRKKPDTLSPAEQRAVLDAIAFERRGLFLAMAHTIRPGEARALDLFHWQAPDLLIQQAVKGQSATSPIRGAKERNWRIVGARDDLAEWIAWRLEKASAEERLKRIGVPLFPTMQTANRKHSPLARWSHHGAWEEWKRACDRAKVRYASMYPGTKHTTATNLARDGVDRSQLQRFLGHADPRSTDAYVVLGAKDVKDLVRRPRG